MRWRAELAPGAVGQFVDIGQKLRALRQQRSARRGRSVVRPFQTGVADVQGEKSHGVGVFRRIMTSILRAAAPTGCATVRLQLTFTSTSTRDMPYGYAQRYPL